MTRLADMTTVTDEMIELAVQWYAAKAHQVPDAFTQVHPLAVRRAEKLAQGDWRRVVVEGTALVVYNHPMW